MSSIDRRTLIAGAAAGTLAGALCGPLADTSTAAPSRPPEPDPAPGSPSPTTTDPDPLFAVLDAVGPLEAGEFHPARALDAMRALVALAPTERTAALRRYVEARRLQRREPPEGLFAVVRALVEVPPRTIAPEPWPGVLQPGWLRPPALGGPRPAQPDDLPMVPRWPVVLLDDVPLVLVRGYVLGGHPEPLEMHLDGLARATWRTEPLSPGPAGSVRYHLIHWGRWADDRETSELIEAQLRRYEAG